jgi:DNA-binding transcriptional ArsR family regulator
VFENSPLVGLAVGRSSVRQRILALLIDESTGRLHLREIQRRAGTSPGTASRELGKLVAAGLIDREAEGNQVYFRAAASPFASMMRSLLVAMPAPEFKPRPPRLPRVRPAETGPATDATLTGGVPPTTEVAPTRAPLVIAASGASKATQAAIRPQDECGGILSSPEISTAGVASGPMASAKETSTAPDPCGLEIAGRLADALRPLYGSALRGVYLSGDGASGAAPAQMEVEVIVVLDKVDQYGAELERTSHACAELSRELSRVVSRIFVAEADWNGGPDGVLPLARIAAVAV